MSMRCLDTLQYVASALHGVLDLNDIQQAYVHVQDAETNWAFDIFGFAAAAPGYSLSLLVCHFVKRAGLVGELHLDEASLAVFARKIEKGYNANNPYHNR